MRKYIPNIRLTYDINEYNYISVSELSLLVSLSVSMSCSVSCTKETVLGLQQVVLPSHLQNSEQASCADEQLHRCEEHWPVTAAAAVDQLKYI